MIPEETASFFNLISKIVVSSDEFRKIIKEEIDRSVAEKLVPEYFTREEMAKIFKIDVRTVSRMSDEQLRKQGFEKTKVNGSLRFTGIKSSKQ